MKSISSAISSFLTLGQISPAEWHGQIPGNTSCMKYMPTRNDYRSKVHTDKVFISLEDTISRTHDNFAMPQTAGENMTPHVYPRFGGWRPIKIHHHPKMRGIKNTKKTWNDCLLKGKKSMKKGTQKLREKGETLLN